MIKRYRPTTLLLEIVMIAATIVLFVPVYWLVNLALRKPNDPAPPLALPTQPTLQNFANAWVEGNLANASVNSAVVTVVSVLLIVTMSSMAAYPLARVARRWSSLAFGFFMAGLLLPLQLGMIPLYSTMRDLGLLGSVWGLVLFYVGLQMPFAVFLYTSFLRSVPIEYEEAALLDGAGPLKTFFHVVFPLVRSATGTVVITNVISVWNDFFTPLLYLSGSGQQTLTVSLYSFVNQYSSDWNLVFAGLVISMAPILILYFFLQKTVIKGFASGLKG